MNSPLTSANTGSPQPWRQAIATRPFASLCPRGRAILVYPNEPHLELIEGDCLQRMSEMRSGSIPLIVTSPPYNIREGFKGGKSKWANARLRNGYGKHADNMPRDEYVAWQRRCLEEMLRLIPENGAIFYNVKDRVQQGLRETPEDIVRGYPV